MKRSSGPTNASGSGKASKQTKAEKQAEGGKSVIAADLSPAAIEKARKAFQAGQPFSHCVLESVFDDAFLESVRRELETKGKWEPMSNDLYTFEQSDDLKKTKLPQLAKMRDVIYSAEFRAFISGVTGIELAEEVDASAARYRVRPGRSLARSHSIMGLCCCCYLQLERRRGVAFSSFLLFSLRATALLLPASAAP